MSEKKGPWDKTGDKRNHLPLGVFIWLGIFVFVGALIGTLFILFLDQSSSEDDFYIELVRLVGVLALVASGLIYVRRVKFGEVVRNISIWTGLAAVVLLGYTYRTELSQIVYRVS